MERKKEACVIAEKENQKIMDLDYANVDAAKALANVIEVTESFNI